jgi:hypothetical protein
MLHQCLTGHDPRTVLSADDDLAGKRAIAFSALMRNDFLIVVTLSGALSVASWHGSPSFHNQ